MIEGSRIAIGFELTDENGNEFQAKSSFKIFDVNALNDLGEMFNTFLKQAGYVRDHDYLFMEDVTEEERDALGDFLTDFRRDRKGIHEQEEKRDFV